MEIPEEIAALDNLTVGSMEMDPVHANAPEHVAIYGDTDLRQVAKYRFQ